MAEEDGSTRTVTVRIEGRVQGVYFRAWTEQNAKQLGLSGNVRNLDDGAVLAIFSGPAEVVAEMLERSKDGPRDAQVTEVIILDEGGAAPEGFEVIASDNWKPR